MRTLLAPSSKWSWQGGFVSTTPIVANLTDDSGDGAIDAHDVPNVVIVASIPDSSTEAAHGVLVVLDGLSGRESHRDNSAWADTTPAVGDLDGDRSPEIVMAQAFDPATFPEPGSAHRRLVALRTDGTGRFSTRFSTRFATMANLQDGPPAIAIADLDRDASPEIIAGREVFDANGQLLWIAGDGGEATAEVNTPTAVDLDGDALLEVITGSEAYRHDGTLLFRNDEVVEATDGLANNAFAAVADLDTDSAPEIVVATRRALFVLDAAGKTLHRRELTNAVDFPYVPTIASIDRAEPPAILLSDGSALHVFGGDLTPRWSVPISGPACCGAASAFDFLDDGHAEVVFGDDQRLQILDGLDGDALFEVTRTASSARFGHPVIADIDGDGVADLISYGALAEGMPSVQAWSVGHGMDTSCAL
jgi:hypothetical protein